MPEGPVVVNNTPLVALCGLGRLGLLETLFGEVLIPRAVYDEFVAVAPPAHPPGSDRRAGPQRAGRHADRVRRLLPPAQGQTAVILDLSLGNQVLYAGLSADVLAGRPTLTTPLEEAILVLLANLSRLPIDPEEVVLTGGMAIWVYLVVFYALHGKTKRIYYEDGRGERILVAAHG